MADTLPPDRKKNAGKQRSGKSGKVADFRYKRSSQQGKATENRANAKRSSQKRGGGPNGDKRLRNAAPRKGQRHTHGFGLHGPRSGEAYAALDLGTNNCRLLIARPSGRDFTVIDAFSRVVKLGEDLAVTGRLSDAAMERTMSALSICADKLRRRNVRLARSVATEACRRATNGEAFIERVKRETGIALDIISAEEEARLAVLGCHILLEAGEGPAVIFDIGGGSTELVLLEPGEKIPRIIDWQSVPWGVVSLTDTIAKVGVGGAQGRDERLARYAKMREVVSESFAPFASRIAEAARHSDIRLLGTSGTVTTLASLHLELPHYDRKAVDGLIVPSDSMREISGRLSGMSRSERSELPCIGQDRADLVVAGCAILESILDIWPASRLGVADRGIREGILRSLMAAERQAERSRKSLAEARGGNSHSSAAG
ncbi:Ppx/GppA family phosphatase [Erythrobacter sp. SCSIO 43205]|uniref:Ppx/GppA phosphatase family protein n=1 Tax=Erythrobacter sp. SCSIO 43205 TaxID=2779361 RepID=UPI001CA9D392|nr:Ppx/GppA phosphatase family protein [Erythrobacter sp. SCSIO 43205]UAB78125.1 Ppx/GppA family phosphatase [Erythrobacter sp. SCSIO 43205]